MIDHNPYRSPQAGLNVEPGAVVDYDTTPVYSPKGRMGRQSYIAWYGIGYAFFSVVLLTFLFGAGFEHGPIPIAPFLLFLVFLLLFLSFSMILSIRRLHDMDKSGWWCLLFIVPVVNLFVGLLVIAQAGTEGENRFGGPRITRPWEKVVAILSLALVTISVLSSIFINDF